MRQASFFENTRFADKPQIDLMLESEHGKEIRICMQKGSEMKEHTAPGAIVIMALSGSVDIGSSEGGALLKAGDAIYFDAKVPHSLIALEDSVIRLSLSKNDGVNRVVKLVS